MSLTDDLEKYRVDNGLKKADMARLFDVPLQNYNNWVYRSSLPKEHYEKARGIISSKALKDSPQGEDMDNAAKLLRNPQLVPLISWVTAGAWCESPDNYAPGDAEEWLPCPSRHSARTYALRVVGDSMTSQNPGERSYPNGTIIFVDPEKAVEMGSRVIVRLPNSSDVTFKTYTVDAGVPYLMPINSRYPTIQMPEGAHICGVVIGSYWPE